MSYHGNTNADVTASHTSKLLLGREDLTKSCTVQAHLDLLVATLRTASKFVPLLPHRAMRDTNHF